MAAEAVAVRVAGVLLPTILEGKLVLDFNADSIWRLLVTDRRKLDFCSDVNDGCDSAEVVRSRLAVSEARIAVLGTEPVLSLTFLDAPDPTAVLCSRVTELAVGCMRLSPVLLADVAAEGDSTARGDAANSAERLERRGLTGLLVGWAMEGGVGVGWVFLAVDLVTAWDSEFLGVGRS